MEKAAQERLRDGVHAHVNATVVPRVLYLFPA